MLQLKKFPDIPVSTREEARESRPHPEEPRFRLLAREERSFLCVFGKEFPAFPSHLKRRRSHRKGESNSRVVPHSQRPPDVSVHSRETCFPCTASTFKPRIDSHHGGTWDIPVGKPHGKASSESLEGKPLIPRSTRREAWHCCYGSVGKRTCMHPLETRLTPLGRLQEYPKIHVSTGEESSGSGTDSTQGFRPQHRRERKPERPPRGPRATPMGTGLSCGHQSGSLRSPS